MSLEDVRANSKQVVTGYLGRITDAAIMAYPRSTHYTFPEQKASAEEYLAFASPAMADAGASSSCLWVLDSLLQSGETRQDRATRIQGRVDAFSPLAFWAERTRDKYHALIDAAADEAAVSAEMTAFRAEVATGPTTPVAEWATPLAALWAVVSISVEV